MNKPIILSFFLLLTSNIFSISPLHNIKNIIIFNDPHLISGGPEALCQLFCECKNTGIATKILWTFDFSKINIKEIDNKWYLCDEARHEGTPIYKQKYHTEHLDFDLILDKSTLIIVPEIYTHMISLFHNAIVGIYWLSIYNFHYTNSNLNTSLSLFRQKTNDGTLIHLSDAPWISKTLQNWGLQSYLIEAPINSHYFTSPKINNKIDQSIAYNPSKGFYLSTLFINKYQHYNFIQLKNLNEQGVINALDSAKIYIDFGHFPGKDRIPREAISRDCVIFIHNNGCATDFESFPIDDYFRFSDEDVTSGTLNDKVTYTLNNYEEMHNKQSYAKNKILNEPATFQQQIKQLFNFSVFQPTKILKDLQSITDYQTKQQIFLELVKNTKKYTLKRDVLLDGLTHITIDGAYLEMGVFCGTTINFIASIKPDTTIHGFDSFEGLPESWKRDDTDFFKKGTFALTSLPKVAHNIMLHKGWFNDTLPHFKKNILQDQPIAFLHIDCDIYSSTKMVFDVLGNNIVHGTIICFDELYNYPGFENHELKALLEFLETKNLSIEFLSYNATHEQVAVKIINKQS